MITLAINTCLNLHQLVIFDASGYVSEVSWNINEKEDDVLVKNLNQLLSDFGKSKFDIDRICVISGPGPFTSVRSGIVSANALAYCLKKPIYALNIFEFLKLSSTCGFDLIVLSSQHGEIFCLADPQDLIDIKKYKFEEFLETYDFAKINKIVYSLNRKSEEMLSEKLKKFTVIKVQFPFQQLVQKLDFDKLESKNIVDAEYFAEAI